MIITYNMLMSELAHYSNPRQKLGRLVKEAVQ